MLDILKDGPFRYLHSRATGELILVLVECGSGFVPEHGEPPPRTLRYWKAIARKHIGEQLITDGE